MSKEFKKRLEVLEMAAQVEVEKEFVRLVKQVLAKNKKLAYAHALMGSILWKDQNGHTVEDYNPKIIADFLMEHDKKYGLSGSHYKIYLDVVLGYSGEIVEL